MNIPAIDRLIGLSSQTLDEFFANTPSAQREFELLKNERNVRNSRVFLIVVIISQLFVGVGRILGELGFPFYNAFLVLACSGLLYALRLHGFKTRVRPIALLLFTGWALTFPFLVIRLGGYESPTYPIYIIMIFYVLIFFHFGFAEYVYLFTLIVASNIGIVFLTAEIDLEDFIYRQVVMLLVCSVAIIGSYINVQVRRNEFYQQFVLEKQRRQTEEAYRRLKEAELQVVQSEKLASLGRMTAGLAHEINNPLGFIRGNLANLRGYVQDLTGLLRLYEDHADGQEIEAHKQLIDYSFVIGDAEKTIVSCDRGVERIADLIAKLRSFTHLDEAELQTVDLCKEIDGALSILSPRAPATAVVRNYGPLPPFECQAALVNQALFSVLENAFDAARSSLTGGSVTITTTCTESTIVVEISDNGNGIPEEIRHRIFDPFFTTKDVGQGVGLGLAVAYGIVRRHGGRISFTTTLGTGTCFLIELPAHARRSAPNGDSV